MDTKNVASSGLAGSEEAVQLKNSTKRYSSSDKARSQSSAPLSGVSSSRVDPTVSDNSDSPETGFNPHYGSGLYNYINHSTFTNLQLPKTYFHTYYFISIDPFSHTPISSLVGVKIDTIIICFRSTHLDKVKSILRKRYYEPDEDISLRFRDPTSFYARRAAYNNYRVVLLYYPREYGYCRIIIQDASLSELNTLHKDLSDSSYSIIKIDVAYDFFSDDINRLFGFHAHYQRLDRVTTTIEDQYPTTFYWGNPRDTKSRGSKTYIKYECTPAPVRVEVTLGSIYLKRNGVNLSIPSLMKVMPFEKHFYFVRINYDSLIPFINENIKCGYFLNTKLKPYQLRTFKESLLKDKKDFLPNTMQQLRLIYDYQKFLKPVPYTMKKIGRRTPIK